MKQVTSLVFTLVLLVFSSICLSAQNPHPYFRNYTTDDGLPSSEVYSCIQDTAGYMWFATDNGLSRFDGYEFKNYGPREGLKHNVVFYMQKDSQGKIWLATMHGQLYYIDRDSIHAFVQNGGIEKINSKPDFLKDFYIDLNDTKYLSIYAKGILKFPEEDPHQQLLPSKFTTPYLALQLRKRWIVGGQGGTFALSKEYFNLIEVKSDSTYYIDNTSLQLTEGAVSSGYWIKQLDNNRVLGFSGSILYESKKGTVIWKRQADFDLELKSFVQDSEGRLLLGLLRGKGIRRYADIEALRENNFEQFLEGISVTQIFQDKWGGYWIGTIDNGIFYCPDFDIKIYDESTGLPQNYITGLDFKNENQAFIGFRNGQVVLFDLRDNQLERIPSLENNIVYDLLYDPSRQELWATDGRPNILKNGKWKTLPPAKGSTSPFAKKMTMSRDSNLIWGGIHVGFGNVNLNEKTNHLTAFELGIRNRTFRVWEDKYNRIWIGNVNGLFEFKNNKLLAPQPFFEPFNTRIEDIGELSDGTLVIATKGEGLLLWKEKYFEQLTTTEGLSTNMLENVYVDEQDQIWAGTLEGLNKITRDGEEFFIKKYTVFHGLPSNEITKVISHQGQVWVATTKGLMQWIEKEQSDFSSIPVFETNLVNNTPVDFLQNQKLTHDQNDFEFHFLTINYNQNGKIPYRFRINNEEWNYTQTRIVNFVDLAPNRYKFEVQSQSKNGAWSASNTINFEIHPAFWQTGWFTLIWVSALLGISWLIYRGRLQKLKADAQIEKEINDLRRSALRAQMNPHFIFNCLNSIQNFIVKKDQENAIRYLAKFAQLIRGTLNASMEEKVTLNAEVRLLENYLNLEKLRFKEQFDFQIKIDKQLDKFGTILPPLLTQPFVENAILHGFAKMKSGGKLNVDYTKKNEKLEIRIQDNGQGIFQSQKNKTASHSGQKNNGVGMSISQKRLELADLLNDFEVKEIKEDNGKVKGTVIRMVLEFDRGKV